MSSQTWLEDVRRELLRRKLPAREIARLMSELADHVEDVMEAARSTGRKPVEGISEFLPFNFMEDHMSKDANVAERLGSPVEVAATAGREYRRRRGLLRRSPVTAFFTFVLLPLPALVAAWAATIAALYALGVIFEWFLREPATPWKLTENQASVTHYAMLAALLVPAACLAILYARLAKTTKHRWRWGLAATLLVALGTMLVHVRVTISDIPGKNQVSIGAGIGRQMWHASQFAQFLIPLGAGTMVLRRDRSQAAFGGMA